MFGIPCCQGLPRVLRLHSLAVAHCLLGDPLVRFSSPCLLQLALLLWSLVALGEVWHLHSVHTNFRKCIFGCTPCLDFIHVEVGLHFFFTTSPSVLALCLEVTGWIFTLSPSWTCCHSIFVAWLVSGGCFPTHIGLGVPSAGFQRLGDASWCPYSSFSGPGLCCGPSCGVESQMEVIATGSCYSQGLFHLFDCWFGLPTGLRVVWTSTCVFEPVILSKNAKFFSSKLVSETILCGIPYLAMWAFSFLMTALQLVLHMRSTSRKLKK